MKRTLVSFLSVGLLFLAFNQTLEAGARSERNQGQRRIIVADTNSTHHLNLYVAYERGLFSQRGLDVVIEQTNASVAAVVGGTADITFACPTAVMSPIAAGSNLSIIAQVKIPCTSLLVVPVNSPIRRPQDIRGLQIAGLSATCCAVIAIRDNLRDLYNVEFELATLAPGAALAALQAGSVSGAILEEPFVAEALLLVDAQGRPRFKTVFDGSSDANGDGIIEANLAGVNPPCRTINANTNFVANRLDDVKLFIEAIEEANRIILANPSAPDIVAIALKYVSVSEQAIINSNPKLGFQTRLDTEGLKAYADALVRMGTFPANPGDGLFAPQLRGITW